MCPPPKPEEIDVGTFSRIRAALVSSEYESDRLKGLLSDDVVRATTRGVFGPARARTASGSPLDTLVRLFVIGIDVSVEQVEDLPDARLDDWLRSGLVTRKGRRVRPLVTIQVLQHGENQYFISADIVPSSTTGAPTSDAVMSATSASVELMALTIRRKFRNALDVGTGNGVQAILLSGHCEHVLASDINRKALQAARRNLALNAIENVELREGDLFSSIKEEDFQLIVSVPPYVVSPAQSYHYRDSGLPLDAMSAQLVNGAALRLDDGGWAIVMCHWACVKDEDWHARVNGWVEGTGCDGLLIQQHRADPSEYALSWTEVDAQRADEEFDRWTEYYREERISSIGVGYIVLRKRAGQNWFAVLDLPENVTRDRGEAVISAFQAQDWLQSRADSGDLFKISFRISDSVHIQTQVRDVDGRWVEDGVTLLNAQGLLSTVHLNEYSAALIGQCDGERTLEQILNELFFSSGKTVVSSVDPQYQRVRREVESLTRHLVATGFLVPVEP
jgi:methylase of polypeptide subunit release factors